MFIVPGQNVTTAAQTRRKPGRKVASKTDGKKQIRRTDTGELDHLCTV